MIVLVLILIFLAFFINKPPIKCFTTCSWNKLMRKIFSKELDKIKKGKSLKSYGLKELKRIYRWTSKYSCSSFNDNFGKYDKTREEIRNEIVDRELLG